MRIGIPIALLVVGLAACSSSTPGTTAASQSHDGNFSMQSRGAAPGGEAFVSLKAEAGSPVTVISELTYDTTKLSFSKCTAGAAGGKNLNVAEPSPGKVRAVLAGDLQALSSGSEVMNCRFKVAANAAAGATGVQVQGEMSDASFTDHPFAVGGTIQIGS